MRVLGPVIVAAILATALTASAEDWGDVKDPSLRTPEFARSQAICRGLEGTSLPQADRPDPAEAASLKGCSSEKLYYGIGMPADPARARQCAVLEQDAPDASSAFSGDAMLMTIYANGVGATRNFDLATVLACRLDGAPAEEDGRVKHLAALKAGHWTGHDFSFCDDITSGYAMGECAAHDAAMADAKRQRQLDGMTAGWSEADRHAFAALQKAEQDFVRARADNEVDQSGTARAALSIGEAQTGQDDFLAMLRTLSAGKAPAFAARQLAQADARLNTAYRRIQATRDTTAWGTVTREGIRATQRAWLRYRDAWVEFAATKYPSVASDSVLTWLTEKRSAALEEFLR